MSDRIEAAFRPLHDTLARLNLLTHLTDENVMLPATESQDLSNWLRDLASKAISQAIAAEQEVASIEPEART